MVKLLEDLKRPLAFVEVGVHSALRVPIQQIYNEHSKMTTVYIPMLTRGAESTLTMVTTIGKLFAYGYEPNFASINPQSGILVDLPNYLWDYSSEYWRENRLSKAWRYLAHPIHELLGARCLESSDLEPAWRNMLKSAAVPWIKDYSISGNIVFPAAGYIAMIGEAIRQITGSEEYSVRNMAINTPMLLEGGSTVEIVTSIRQVPSDSGKGSLWFSFSIVALHNDRWTRHCIAEGRAGHTDHHAPAAKIIDPYSRSVHSKSWYRRATSLRLELGPHFQTLDNVTASPTENSAAATIGVHHMQNQATYAAHPTVIDACFQLMFVASRRGILYDWDKLLVPLSIDYIMVKPNRDELVASSSVRLTNKRCEGDVTARTKSGDASIHVYNATAVQLDDTPSANLDSTTRFARLEWRLDINYSDPINFLRKPRGNDSFFFNLEKVACLSILRILDVLETLPPTCGYLSKQRGWLQEEKQGMESGRWTDTVPEAQKWVHLASAAREDILESALTEIQASEPHLVISICQMLKRLSNFEATHGIFTGKTDPLQLLTDHRGLANLYDFADITESLEDLISLYAHAQPGLRVLEVGAGTGGTTKAVLDILTSDQDALMYSEYMFTDVSAGFFPAS